MEISEKIKKIAALLALIDDTEEEIKVAKVALDERVHLLRQGMKTHYDAIQAILGDKFADPYARASSTNQLLRRRALLFVGSELINPTPDEEPNGQTT